MSRVFVVQGTLKKTVDGQLVPKHNLESAREFGQIVEILSPSAKPFVPEPVIRDIRQKLSDFGPDDYLLLIGNPALIGFVVAIASQRSSVRLLQWDGVRKKYVEIVADLQMTAV